MTEPLSIIVLTALLSSGITVFAMWLYERRMRRDLERRLKDWHDEIGRTVEMRVKRAVIESLADMNAVDVIRDTTWKAARSGTDLLSDGLNVLLGKRAKRQE